VTAGVDGPVVFPGEVVIEGLFTVVPAMVVEGAPVDGVVAGCEPIPAVET
jgi:hypothetical protein